MPFVEHGRQLSQHPLHFACFHQTTGELDKMIEKMTKTQNKSHEAHGKADMERAHIKKELDSVRDALTEIK